MKKEFVRAELWKIMVYGSVMDSIHGFYQEISEVYIPKYKITFNCVDSKVNLFKTEKSRYTASEEAVKDKDIEISYSLVETLVKYLDTKDSVNKEISEFLSTIDGIKK